MSERRVGIVVTGAEVRVVDAEIPTDIDEPITIVADETWALPKGARPDAYDVVYRRCANYLAENKIGRVVIKASEASRSAGLAHLESAEFRGVIIAAAASVSDVTVVKKSVISKTYGGKKVGEYVKDDGFWDEHTDGDLRKASREAAMLLVATRKPK
jgi:hypothetical protein